MPRFKELVSFPVAKNKEVVISENDQGSLVMAQRVIHQDENGTQKIFLKGAMIISEEYIVDAKLEISKAFEIMLSKM